MEISKCCHAKSARNSSERGVVETRNTFVEWKKQEDVRKKVEERKKNLPSQWKAHKICGFR
ncbi:MAG: hypothetical protein BGO25_11755 [Acidobacteriales bacterium 59-55]|nr:MAG: hypothetical protein BGO25_11755 [Acidobacteriales bacterium 59-55]